MAADLMQHVIEKGHSGRGLTSASAVKIELDLDVGFAGMAVNFTLAHAVEFPPTVANALIMANHLPIGQTSRLGQRVRHVINRPKKIRIQHLNQRFSGCFESTDFLESDAGSTEVGHIPVTQ
jgi:hypothetical protein